MMSRRIIVQGSRAAARVGALAARRAGGVVPAGPRA